jgi:hypothetical protein
MNESVIQSAPDFWICPKFADDLKTMGLDSLESVFAFEGGRALVKKELTSWRSRTEFVLPSGNIRCFLKRYNRPPVRVQLRNWLDHGKRAMTAEYDVLPCRPLNQRGVGTYQPVAYGGRWDGLWEDKSFAILREIPDAESLETKLPNCFAPTQSGQNIRQRRDFIHHLADFARRFHQTGFCHRDFYLCHIFRSSDNTLSLIDLQRAFVPRCFRSRWILKDLSQLYFSSPGDIISRADRLRFYLRYAQRDILTARDRRLIQRLKRRVWAMADRDIRRGKEVPFAK